MNEKRDWLDRVLGWALSFLAGMGFVSAIIAYQVYSWGA